MPVMVRSVLISDQVDARCAELLRSHGIAVTQRTKMPKEELINELKNHDALIVRSETKVTADVLAGAGSGLRVVGRAGTGVDNIDVDAATRKGVIVLNTPGGNSISACELTCSLITTLARNVPQACQSLKEGRWDRKLYTGSELYGKTLAVLGLGRIGREVATRMQAFGMETIGFDPIISAEAAQQFGVKKMELDEIWPQADYITVHTPLIPQTKNLINEAVLKKCKNSVKIINVARGGIVDEAALLSAIKEGQCGGAALDVFCEEPPKSPVTLELISLPQVIATPHLGASTEEAQTRVAVEIAEQIIALAENLSEQERQRYTLTGVINAPVLAASMQANNAPWISLGKELGRLTAAMAQGPIPGTEIKVTATGPGSDRMTYLGTAVLMGMLAGRTKNGLNLVNAATLAKESGLSVTLHRINSAKGEGGDSNNSTIIAIALHQKDGETNSITGTVLADGRPHLLSVNGATFESGVPLGESNVSGTVRTQLRLLKGNLQTVLGVNTLGSLTSVSVARCLKGGETWVAVRSEEQVGEI